MRTVAALDRRSPAGPSITLPDGGLLPKTRSDGAAAEADSQLTGATADLAERLHLSDATVKIHITTARRSAGRADPLPRYSASRARCLALRTATGTPPSPASNSPKNLTCTRPPYDHRTRPHLSSLRPR